MGALPPHLAEHLNKQPETGMGYQIVSVWLDDGRRFDQVIVTEGTVTQVRGYADVPFDPLQAVRIELTHKKWDFRNRSEDLK